MTVHGQVVEHVISDTAAIQAGHTVLVAAQTGKKVQVVSLVVNSLVADTVVFRSSTTDIVWKVYAGATGGIVLDAQDGQVWFETAAGETLTFTCGVADGLFIDVGYKVES